MTNHAPVSAATATALQRFALVSKVKDLLTQQLPLSAALEAVARTPVQDADGLEFIVATRTLEDWWYAFRKGGFAALHPKARSDRGQSRVLTPEQCQRILDCARAQPGLPIKVLYRQWRQADPQLPGLSTIYRALRSHDLDHDARRRQLTQALSGPTKAFEAPAVNDLWMADFSPGLSWVSPEGQAHPTHLCAIIDDHSRLIVAAHYHAQANTQSFHYTLKEAIQRRGLPRKLYTDQGGPFINDHTRIVCANLQIRLLHAKPYHAWSKGKIERFFRTLQEDFEAQLRQPGHAPKSLDDLNGRLADWLQSVYHIRPHSSTDQSPQVRFQAFAPSIRSVDPAQDLNRLFFARLKRQVRKDGTIRIDNQLFEVDLALRGFDIDIAFNPWTLERIEVSYRGKAFGLARRLNRQLNSQLPQ